MDACEYWGPDHSGPFTMGGARSGAIASGSFMFFTETVVVQWHHFISCILSASWGYFAGKVGLRDRMGRETGWTGRGDQV